MPPKYSGGYGGGGGHGGGYVRIDSGGGGGSFGGGHAQSYTTVDEFNALVEEIRQQQLGVHESFLMATGSADHHVYLYDVGDSVVQSRSGAPSVAPLLQQLHGHTDRVYAVHFHPVHALLASCSADFTIKLWAPRGRA